MPDDARKSWAYQEAVKRLKAEGDTNCWSCGKPLYAHLPYPHPNSITLGHYIALEDGGHLTDRSNHAAQCIACNMSDGARRTNKKRNTPPPRESYRNNNW